MLPFVLANTTWNFVTDAILSLNIYFENILQTRGVCKQNESVKSVEYMSWSWYLTKGNVSVRNNFKFMLMIVKIGEWTVKWQLKVAIVSWNMLSDKWVERWIWGGESPNHEGEN